MRLSNNGVALIKREEGERLTAYQDSVGIWTIGVGHTGTVNGRPVSRGMTIKQNKSTELLLSDLSWVESSINKAVRVPLSQNQYDALCSFIFNVGKPAFESSTLLKKLNDGDYDGAADQLLLWKRAGNIPDLLLPRRKRERELFKA